MRRRIASLAAFGVITSSLVLFAIGPAEESDARFPKFGVLVFSKTAGFRHDSIPAGIGAIRSLGKSRNFTVVATESSSVFKPRKIRRFEAIVFLNTTGDVLTPRRQKALKAYIRGGGGFVGIHSATDTEYGWPFYGGLVGAYFKSHPAAQQATVRVTDPSHPSTKGLPSDWTRTDEWYDFTDNPRGRVHVLATVDESTYTGGGMGADHPIAWCHPFRGGRSFYTAGGHTAEAFSEPLFRQHLLGGIRWAAGKAKSGCRPG